MTVLLKLIVDVLAVLQTVCVAGIIFIVGVGNTLTVNDCTAPGQELAVGVTAITATAVTVPELMAVNDGMGLAVPELAKPMDVLELVHAYVVPPTELLKEDAPTVAPLQTVWLAGTVATGVVFTLTIAVAVFVQPVVVLVPVTV